MTFVRTGSEDTALSSEDVREIVDGFLTTHYPQARILAIPPDATRSHSFAGMITEIVYRLVGDRLTDVLPALGTHVAMGEAELRRMFATVPLDRFRVHDWRTDLVTLGTVPESFVLDVGEGCVSYDWPAQVNRLVAEGGHDLILSIGQVVPHEVIGMANHSKNIFVGTGGKVGIDRSHFLGAAYGMERIMGRADSPVRAVLDYAAREFASALPIVYILTVVEPDSDGTPQLRGLFIGDDRECFDEAASLSRRTNVNLVDEAPQHVVAYLAPDEFHSTWLGNKAIYRTRMLVADGGTVTVLAPGVRRFGEDDRIDRLIRRYGYVGRDRVTAMVETEQDLRENLSAAAHLIHGSSDGRFTVEYAAGHLSREEVESVGYRYLSPTEAARRYDRRRLRDGWSTDTDGNRVYYVSNPALGLWALRERFGADTGMGG